MQPRWTLFGIGLLLVAAVSPTVHADQEPQTLFVVPAGTVMVLDAPVTADEVQVDGTLWAVEDLVLQASTIRIGPEAELVAGHGEAAPAVAAHEALGAAGESGHDVLLEADRLTVTEGALVLAGSGGAGGGAAGVGNATGGSGGDGGSVRMLADASQIDGAVLPGAGGQGGHAFLAGAGEAVGGDGGGSGTVTLNGAKEVFGFEEVEAPPTSYSGLGPALCALTDGVCGNGVVTCTDLLECAGIEMDGDLVQDLLDLVSLCSDNACLQVLQYPAAVVGALVQAAGGAMSSCGVDPLLGEGDALRGDGDAGSMDSVLPWTCEQIIDGLISDATTLTPAGPGMSGTPTTGCMQPTGSPGSNGVASAGDGGNGGDGCTYVSGGAGQGGKSGNSGFFGCTDGGNGGHGGHASSGGATGGRGGDGFKNGGNGGSADSTAVGGDGGAGGSGGKATIGRDCAGGHGGFGGNAKSGDVTPGAGGNGLCGKGGNGGHATTTATSGAGGSGGAGTPAGVSGAPGTAAPGAGGGAVGPGGVGPGAC